MPSCGRENLKGYTVTWSHEVMRKKHNGFICSRWPLFPAHVCSSSLRICAPTGGRLSLASEISYHQIYVENCRNMSKYIGLFKRSQVMSSLSNVQPSFDRDPDAPNSARKLGACTSLHMLWAAWHSHRSYQNRKLDMFKRRSLQHQTNVPFLAKVPSIEKIESKLPSRV